MKSITSTCPVCQSSEWEPFFPLPNVPVYCNVLWERQQAARQCPKGDIELAICHSCGMIANVAFDPALVSYDPHYENSLHFSPRFQNYADTLARRLIKTYNLKGKTVIELGCGKGEFLALLCRLEEVRGIGFDPTYVNGGPGSDASSSISVIRDVFSEQYADLECNLVCCRHTLEHVPDPAAFLNAVRHAIGQRRTPVFFEVPNAWFMLRQGSVWDVIYEHYSYFSPPSLARLFHQCRITVEEVREDFGDQFLCLHGMSGNEPTSGTPFHTADVATIVRTAKEFGKTYRDKVDEWKKRLERLRRQRKRVVIWGAGSKGVTFLNVVGETGIEYAVDLNPRKHKRFVPGTGQQVVSPTFLRQYRPDVVVVMNPIYQHEIQEQMRGMALPGPLITL
jgi:SAM-dependent methyltransferase